MLPLGGVFFEKNESVSYKELIRHSDFQPGNQNESVIFVVKQEKQKQKH